MPIKHHAAYKRPGVNSVTKERESTTRHPYIITGTDDYTAAEIYAKNNLPLVDVNLWRSNIDIAWLAPNRWLATANYTHPDNQKTEDHQQKTDPDKVSFDTSGATTHITQSRGTTRHDVSAGTPGPDHNGAINVNMRGSVDGVDIVSPAMRWTVDRVLSFNTQQDAFDYIRTLGYMTGTTNDAPFKGYDTGECLFMGASGRQRPNQRDWEITFNFDISETEVLTVAGIAGILKEGWQYLWVLYRDEEDNNHVTQRPIAVYVEDVYKKTDFDDLEIGV